MAWTTEEQAKFLKTFRFIYRERQAARTLEDFWPELYVQFLEKWPELDVPPPEKKVKGNPDIRTRLRQWFNNHCRGEDDEDSQTADTDSTNGATPSSSKRKSSKLLDFSGKTSRKGRDYQVYTKLYWEERIRKTYESERAAYEASLPAGAKKKTAVIHINEVARRLLAEEDAETKATVARATINSKHEPEGEEEVDEQLAEESHRAAQNKAYADAIALLPSTTKVLLDEIHKQTGWPATILFGGPSPAQGGKIVVYAVHTELKDKRSFATAHPNYHDTVEKEYRKFILSAFPPSVRAERALPGTLDDRCSSSREGSVPQESGPADTPTDTDGDVPASGPAKLAEKVPAPTKSEQKTQKKDKEKTAKGERKKKVGEPDKTRRMTASEKARQKNILRNKEILKKLGLGNFDYMYINTISTA
ncbi:hypothetical protein FA95DRAFT_1612876 [Auriscalpium vulgare]|uniref:Uncharacterized protein n=1 Tax=Auriscalpium vulgare TaxID=40419 RepID=A0ACB8R665_9AGAM|nr:hypothetical protein FA95DRAFT_1612876 [Auriscalpium vulgare]